MSVRFHRSFGLLELIVLFLLPLICGVLIVAYRFVKPVLVQYASAALYQTTYTAASDVISEITKDQKELVSVIENEKGEIVSLNTDAWRLNSIKAETVSRMISTLRRDEYQTIEIPLGSITGSLLFSGRGPKLRLSVLPVTTVEAEYRNEFFDAGINQTIHRLMMRIIIHTGFLCASQVVSETVELDLCLSETVIIGKIPQLYAGIE